MPLDYLRQIQHAEFPLQVDDPKEIDCVAVLLAAEMVVASVSKPSGRTQPDPPLEFAIVERITALGRMELARRRE